MGLWDGGEVGDRAEMGLEGWVGWNLWGDSGWFFLLAWD